MTLQMRERMQPSMATLYSTGCASDKMVTFAFAYLRCRQRTTSLISLDTSARLKGASVPVKTINADKQRSLARHSHAPFSADQFVSPHADTFMTLHLLDPGIDAHHLLRMRIPSTHDDTSQSTKPEMSELLKTFSHVNQSQLHRFLQKGARAAVSRMISMAEYIFHGTTTSSNPARFMLVQRSQPALDRSPSLKPTRS